jgi:hypothetical protein
MFVQLQFPIADLRRFVEDDVGRLPVPLWPSPGPKEHGFLRGLGPIRWRPRGGMPNWILEEFVCESRALRLLSRADGSPDPLVKLRFCRLFHDGLCVAKIDLGFALQGVARADEVVSDPKALSALISDLFALKIQHRLTKKEIPLSQFGSFFKRQYGFATTAVRRDENNDVMLARAAALIEAGPPVAFVEIRNGSIGQASNSYHELSPQIFTRFSLVQVAQERLPVWTAAAGSGADPAALRRLRVALTRVQTEVFCLRSVLARVEQKRIAPARDSEARNKLHTYLSEVKDRISLDKLVDGKNALVLREAAAAYDKWRPAYIASLMQQLVHLDLKRNIYYDTAKLLPQLDEQAVRELGEGKGITVIAKEFVMKKFENSQVGVINEGSGTVTTGAVTQTQTTITQTTSFDAGALASELAKAIAEAKPTTADNYAEVAALAKAKEAAEKGDKPGVLSALKAAGQWTLDLAQKVGALVLTEIVKKQIGI